MPRLTALKKNRGGKDWLALDTNLRREYGFNVKRDRLQTKPPNNFRPHSRS
jgi:hypothetical protein